MSEDQIRTILSALGKLQVGQARLEEKVDTIRANDHRDEITRFDHEQRIRALEVAKGEVDGVDLAQRVRVLENNESEGRGMWKLLSAGGAIGAGIAFAVLRALGG